MDKAAAEAKQIEGAQVEQITDNNGLQAVKVTFDSGILFTTGNATLSAAAKSALSKFANNVLNQNRDMDVSIYGYTDNQGWRNSTAEQSRQKNLNLSQERAQSAFHPARLKVWTEWAKVILLPATTQLPEESRIVV